MVVMAVMVAMMMRVALRVMMRVVMCMVMMAATAAMLMRMPVFIFVMCMMMRCHAKSISPQRTPRQSVSSLFTLKTDVLLAFSLHYNAAAVTR